MSDKNKRKAVMKKEMSFDEAIQALLDIHELQTKGIWTVPEWAKELSEAFNTSATAMIPKGLEKITKALVKELIKYKPELVKKTEVIFKD